jgi:hypothetical protein
MCTEDGEFNWECLSTERLYKVEQGIASSELELVQILVSDSSPRISSVEQISEHPTLGHRLVYDVEGRWPGVSETADVVLRVVSTMTGCCHVHLIHDLSFDMVYIKAID